MKKLLLVLLMLLGLIPVVARAAAVTPEGVRAFFDANAMFFMFIFGLIWKYVPALKKLTNDVVPWINAVGYILAGVLGATQAHASIGGAVGAVPDAIGLIVAGASNSVVTALLFDKLAKPWLNRWLGFKPAAKI